MLQPTVTHLAAQIVHTTDVLKLAQAEEKTRVKDVTLKIIRSREQKKRERQHT